MSPSNHRTDNSDHAQIDFQDGIPDDQRRDAEQSVATLVDRHTSAMSGLIEDSRERSSRAEALGRPLLDILRNDPAAAEALNASSGRLPSVDDLDPSSSPLKVRPGNRVITVEMDSPGEVFVPPYHFNWSWHLPSGSPPFSSFADRPSGQIGLHARIGPQAGAPNAFMVNAHAGFGISLTTAAAVRATGRAMRRVGHRYSLAAGFQGDATVEGWQELTAFEDGVRMLGEDQKRLYRRRVSGASILDPTESAVEDSGGIGVGEPMELTWIMHPGHTYTFNVGQWVFCERHPGLGGAEAIAQIFGEVILMTLFR